jgi:hypothetical protein
MNHLPDSYAHWIRQKSLAQNTVTNPDRLFQISKESPNQERPLVVASCGMSAAHRFLAAVAMREGAEHYRISAIFLNPSLPGLER